MRKARSIAKAMVPLRSRLSATLPGYQRQLFVGYFPKKNNSLPIFDLSRLLSLSFFLFCSFFNRNKDISGLVGDLIPYLVLSLNRYIL